MKNTEAEHHQLFKIGTQVEVTSNEEGFKNSWYKCTIVPPPTPTPKSKNTPHLNKQNKRRKNFYWVEYEAIVEEEDQSIPVREYTEGCFIRPLRQESSACSDGFEKFDIVEANFRYGWWVGVVQEVLDDGLKYLVGFLCPYEEIEFQREELRAHLSWVGGDNWILVPKKNAMHCLQDGNEAVVSNLLDSVAAEVSDMERTLPPAKRLQQITSCEVEGQPSLEWKNAVQALTAPPLVQSSQLSSSEGNTNCNREIKVSDRDSCCSMILSNNNGNGNKIACKSDEKKRRVPKGDIKKFLNLLQNGEQPGESGAMDGSTDEQSPTSDAADSHCGSPMKEIQITEIAGDINDVEEVVDEQGDCQSKALVLYSNLALSEPSKSRPATLHVHSEPDKSQSWPFTKRSEMWRVIESMEAFKRIPQMPHFSPLKEHEENSREMFAICMMTRFTYEVERITAGFPDDLQSTRVIHDSLDNLKELESHGFTTIPLEAYLNELLRKIEREKELQETLKVIENDIIKCQAEKTEAEKTLSEAVEEMKYLQAKIEYKKTIKTYKEEKAAQLRSRKSVISRELHHVRLTKRRRTLQW